ncbi:MAG: hypothetical protein LBK45_07545 [Tannerellaceae bacterium]|nr:hypothetical protein [Tannerellaceae bacterium]
MEAITIQKNVAGLKSLMSKRIKYFVMAVGLVVFCGCETKVCAEAALIEYRGGSFTFERDTVEVIHAQKYKMDLTGVPDWVTIVEKQDDGWYSYEAIISENESTESRSATIHGSVSKDVKTECAVTVSGSIGLTQLGKPELTD